MPAQMYSRVEEGEDGGRERRAHSETTRGLHVHGDAPVAEDGPPTSDPESSDTTLV